MAPDRPLTSAEEEAQFLGLNARTEDDVKADAAKTEAIELRRKFLVRQMENPMFREWLMEVLVGFNTFGRTFAAGPTGFPDHAATEFHLGLKAAGWHLFTIFDDVAPDLASKMRRNV